MGISRKQIKKAIHRLRVDGKTPHDVIDFINKKLCTNKVEFEEIQNCGDNKILLPTSTILSDVSNLKGIMNGITFNTGNGLLIKRTYNTLCNNFKRITKKQFPLSYEETNEVIQAVKDGNKLQAVKLIKINSGLGLRESKNILDVMFFFVNYYNMAQRKLKQGMVVVLDTDIFSNEAVVLLSRVGNKIKSFYLREYEVIEIDKDEMLENIKKGKWLLRVPDEL